MHHSKKDNYAKRIILREHITIFRNSLHIIYMHTILLKLCLPLWEWWDRSVKQTQHLLLTWSKDAQITWLIGCPRVEKLGDIDIKLNYDITLHFFPHDRDIIAKKEVSVNWQKIKLCPYKRSSINIESDRFMIASSAIKLWPSLTIICGTFHKLLLHLKRN